MLRTLNKGCSRLHREQTLIFILEMGDLDAELLCFNDQSAFHTQPLDWWKQFGVQRGGGKRYQDCIIHVQFSSKEGGGQDVCG